MKRKAPGLRLEATHPAPVAGVDEAGRGPFAGPVCAAAVILPEKARLRGVDDSKRLTAEQRYAAETLIKRRALAWSVAFATVEEIAHLNILGATGLAMRRAVEGLALTPAFVLIDGDYLFDLPCRAATVVGGDRLSLSIAAASILAKTARDRLMVAMDQAFPGYGFAAHKGYGVPAHLAALKSLGPCPLHRTSWEAVRATYGQGELELDLPDQA